MNQINLSQQKNEFSLLTYRKIYYKLYCEKYITNSNKIKWHLRLNVNTIEKKLNEGNERRSCKLTQSRNWYTDVMSSVSRITRGWSILETYDLIFLGKNSEQNYNGYLAVGCLNTDYGNGCACAAIHKLNEKNSACNISKLQISTLGQLSLVNSKFWSRNLLLIARKTRWIFL